MMDKYIYIRSDESNDYFVDNKPYNFKIHLLLPLTLNGFWKVGLMEFHAQVQSSIRSKRNLDETLFIYTDLCKGTIIQGREQPLLRRLENNTNKGWSYVFHDVIYLPMNKKQIIEFEVNLKDGDGNEASFLKEPLWMLLHLKPYPFFSDYESV